jgi:tight adherence protein B
MKDRVPTIAVVAGVVQRLAVLLAAGVPPVAAWGYLREGELTTRIATRATAGEDIPHCIVDELGGLPEAEAKAWRGLAMAWAVATEAGAPLAPTLRDFAASLRDLAQAQRDITVALAAPVATARLVMALPLIGVLFGMVLGFNILGTLFTTPIGWACLVLGCGMMWLASRWNRRLVRAAQPRDLTPGLEFDLTAIAVSGGGSLDRARAAVAAAMERFGRPVAEVAHPEAVAQPTSRRVELSRALDAVLDLSRRAGVPAAELLRSEASERRRAARADVQERAQALSIRLMLPLGVCVLPAFMVLGVVPLLVSVISSTSIG